MSGTDGGAGVLIDRTPGRWHTDYDTASGHFVVIDPSRKKAVLQGVSMTGFETGTRESASGAGFWLYNSNHPPESTGAPTVIKNVVTSLTSKWKTDVIRVPICGSAWTQNYGVKDYGNTSIAAYKDWVDTAVTQARSAGKVVILDLHYADFEDGCSGVNKVGSVDSCAPSDWFTANTTQWDRAAPRLEVGRNMRSRCTPMGL